MKRICAEANPVFTQHMVCAVCQTLHWRQDALTDTKPLPPGRS